MNYDIQCEINGIPRTSAYRILKENPTVERAEEYVITQGDLSSFRYLKLYIATIIIQVLLCALVAASPFLVVCNRNPSRPAAIVCLILQIVPCILTFLGRNQAILQTARLSEIAQNPP